MSSGTDLQMEGDGRCTISRGLLRGLRFLLGLFLLALSSGGREAAAEEVGAEMSGPEDVWRGVDPEALPLEVEVVRSSEESGCLLERVRFTVETFEGRRVRAFAIQGAPAGSGRCPGILHIHGGGQTASAQWVRYWVERGYVCLSHDFCGPWESRTEFTDWGPLSHANMAKTGDGYQVRPTPRSAAWFHWALAARRALTLLARHPRVDPARLGVFGISVGGTLTWMVAASDRRVAAAAPIYGCGYNVDPRKTVWGFPEPSADALLYRRVLSPEAHAPSIRCPVLFLSATNDFHGWMDHAYEILGSVRSPTRLAFTPRYNHHLEPEEGGDLERWMDWHLRDGKPWPRGPRIEVDLASSGTPRAVVSADEPGLVQSVKVYYSLGRKPPPARFWRGAQVSRQGERWEAALPVLDAAESFLAFANVTYRSAVSLSSNLVEVVPQRLGKAGADLRWSADIDGGGEPFESWFFARAYTDPDIDKTYFRAAADPERERSFTLNPELFGEKMDFGIATHRIGDPQHRGREGMSLAFDCRGGFEEGGLTVTLTEHDWTPRSRTFSARVGQEALGPGWKTVVLPRSAFRSRDGRGLDSWAEVDKLELSGVARKTAPPCFSRFHWTAGAAATGR